MIIAFVGKMGVGKSEVLNYLKKRNLFATSLKFAQPLYDLQNIIYNNCGLELEGEKDRKLLQWLGTDWGREKDQNLWVNMWKDRAEKAISHGQVVLVDDCRFLNEAKVIKEMGGTIIKIVGPQRGDHVEGTNHKSEKDTELIEEDFLLTNMGTTDELGARIEMALIPFLKERGVKL